MDAAQQLFDALVSDSSDPTVGYYAGLEAGSSRGNYHLQGILLFNKTLLLTASMIGCQRRQCRPL